MRNLARRCLHQFSARIDMDLFGGEHVPLFWLYARITQLGIPEKENSN